MNAPAKEPDYSKSIAVVWNGQIAQMLVQDCRENGQDIVVIGEKDSPVSPAAQALGKNGHHIAIGAGYQERTWELLGLAWALVDNWNAVSAEFENVPKELIGDLESLRVRLNPGKNAFSICRDKWREKTFFLENGIPCTDFVLLSPWAIGTHKKDIEALLPGFLKICEMGYDGTGQKYVRDLQDLENACKETPFAGTTCILEKRIDFEYEMSVILGRDEKGGILIIETPRNYQANGILVASVMGENVIEKDIRDKAVNMAIRAAKGLGYMGVLTVEFFVRSDGSVLANEMAPRPHNSGHHTIEHIGALSQYGVTRLLSATGGSVKSILKNYANAWETQNGIPFARPTHAVTGLVNVLGNDMRDFWLHTLPDINYILPESESNAWALYQVRDYGKGTRSKPTKLGHVVTSADTLKELTEQMEGMVKMLHPLKAHEFLTWIGKTR